MDWIDAFISATDGLPSPRRFRLWAAIVTISGVMERRVWSVSEQGELFPNLYISLVGASGSGKTTAIKFVRALWASVKEVKLGPDNMTNAAFYDALYDSGKMIGLSNGGQPSYYSAMAIVCREMGVLFPKYDTGFFSDLSDIYDNPPTYNSKRRVSKTVLIEAPTVNIITGTTPSFLGDLLPESAWGQGFCARMVFIYATSPFIKGRNLLMPSQVISELPSLAKELNLVSHLSGPFTWSPAANAALHFWYNDGNTADIPSHTRLLEYNTRRSMLVMKLSMISAISSSRGLTVELEDFERALSWMLDAEQAMPDLFLQLNQGADAQILRDLHHHIVVIYNRKPIAQREPVPEQELWHFLRNRTDSWRIKSIIEAAERSGLMIRGTYPDEWIPGTRTNGELNQ